MSWQCAKMRMLIPHKILDSWDLKITIALWIIWGRTGKKQHSKITWEMQTNIYYFLAKWRGQDKWLRKKKKNLSKGLKLVLKSAFKKMTYISVMEKAESTESQTVQHKDIMRQKTVPEFASCRSIQSPEPQNTTKTERKKNNE